MFLLNFTWYQTGFCVATQLNGMYFSLALVKVYFNVSVLFLEYCFVFVRRKVKKKERIPYHKWKWLNGIIFFPHKYDILLAAMHTNPRTRKYKITFIEIQLALWPLSVKLSSHSYCRHSWMCINMFMSMWMTTFTFIMCTMTVPLLIWRLSWACHFLPKHRWHRQRNGCQQN